MRRGIYRGINSALFRNPGFLKLSAPARHLFLTLRLSHEVGPACIFTGFLSLMCDYTGYPPDVVSGALEELRRDGWIETEENVIWIVNGLRYDPFVHMGDTKHEKAIRDSLEGLPRLKIVLRFCDYYGIDRPFDDPLEDPSKGHRRTPPPPPTPTPTPGIIGAEGDLNSTRGSN